MQPHSRGGNGMKMWTTRVHNIHATQVCISLSNKGSNMLIENFDLLLEADKRATPKTRSNPKHTSITIFTV